MVAMELTADTENKLWGIYHTDLEHARMLGDPLRTTIEPSTKEAAEETSTRLGFSPPWAYPIESEMAKLTEVVLKKPAIHRQTCSHKTSRGT